MMAEQCKEELTCPASPVLARMDEKLDFLVDVVRELKINVTGNGDYKRGLLSRTDKLEATVGVIKKLTWMIFGSVGMVAIIYFGSTLFNMMFAKR